MTRDWLVREQTCLGPLGECLGRLLQLWKKGSFAGELLPLDIRCTDGSDDWVILTILMGKEVEDRYPRIVLQVNSRARENNSNVYARGRLSFLVCFRASLNVVFFRIVKVYCHTVLLREISAFDLSINLRGEVLLRNC